MGFFWEGLLLYPIPWGNLSCSSPICSDITGTYCGDADKLMTENFGQCLSIESMSSFAPSTEDGLSSYSSATISKGNLLVLISQAIPPRDTSTHSCLNAHRVDEFNIPGAEEKSLPAEIHTVTSARDSIGKGFPWQI